MKALILCAGYARRMYPLTRDKPKPLLTVAGKPALEYILSNLKKASSIDEIYIVTNEKFFHLFKKWHKRYKSAKRIFIYSDGTASEDAKLGAVGDIKFMLESASIKDDLLIVAGDNLFSFNINKLIRFFKQKGTTIALYDVKSKKLAREYSEVKIDEQSLSLIHISEPTRPY